MANIRADLKRSGRMIANEFVIAAHARCPGLTLVTNNIPEFGRVTKSFGRELDDRLITRGG